MRAAFSRPAGHRGHVFCVPGSHRASPPLLNSFLLLRPKYHTGKTGYALGVMGAAFTAEIASNRSRLPGDPAVVPFALSEHAPHTTAVWNAQPTTGDVFFEASRLGSQILFSAAQGFETLVFKFSAAEQSSGITSGCVQQTAAAWTPATACGVQKVGLHWAENAVAPYPIGDVTLAGETARLLYGALAGGFALVRRPQKTRIAQRFSSTDFAARSARSHYAPAAHAAAGIDFRGRFLHGGNHAPVGSHVDEPESTWVHASANGRGKRRAAALAGFRQRRL